MAAAGVEFGTRVTRGRNRTPEGVLATMQLLVDAGAQVDAQMVSEPRRRLFDGNAVQGAVFTYGIRERPSQMPNVNAVPHETALHGAAERGYTSFVKFLVEHGADLQIKDAEGRTALDLAKGLGVAGVRQAQGEGFPETVKAIEALMAAKGIAVSAPR
jgi:hypothetical protein